MKKVISVLLTLVLLTGVLGTASSFAWKLQTDDTFTLGDANGDGVTNSKDSVMIKAYIARLDGVSITEDAADINADSKISAADSMLLKASIAKLTSLSDYENGNSIYSLKIGGAPIEQFCILLDADTVYDSNERYAAEMLQKYVKMAAGFELELCYGTPSSAHYISFNRVDEDSTLGIELGIEGYKYTVEDGNLNIFGTRRGNMYAVYSILEDYLGYRYYNSVRTLIYKSRTVEIPEGTDETFVPTLSFRYCDQSFGLDSALEYYFPRKMNGSQLYGFTEEMFGTLTGPHFINAHSFLDYLAMSEGDYTNDSELRQCYDSGHAKIDESNKTAKNPITVTTWQPCATADDVYDEMFLGMRRVMTMIQGWGHVFRCDKGDAGTSSMSFSINDNNNYCGCRYCYNKAIVKGEGYSGLYVDMANRAARDIQEYYPEMKIFLIIYEHTVPKTVRPDEHLIITYCRIGCANHFLGSGECGDNKTCLGTNNTQSDYDLVEWGKLCKETGAQLWLWYYPTTVHYYMADSPNIINIYYDFKYLVEKCNVSGIYYEGGGQHYNFEYLKAYLASKMMWKPDMSYEEFTDIMKEYLYMYYGDGNEELYQYLLMQDEAGNASGFCFINDHDRPGDMYSYSYLDEHYEEMRALLVTALGKTKDEEQEQHVLDLIMTCDFMGLSSAYDRMYTNGNAAQKQLYMERYDGMYNRLKALGTPIFSNVIYSLPAEIDYTVNPMIQFYQYGSNHNGVTP